MKTYDATFEGKNTFETEKFGAENLKEAIKKAQLYKRMNNLGKVKVSVKLAK